MVIFGSGSIFRLYLFFFPNARIASKPIEQALLSQISSCVKNVDPYHQRLARVIAAA